MQGHSKWVAGHTNAGTEDLLRSLLVQLIGGCGLGFPGCKWGWELNIPNSVPHSGRRVGWRPDKHQQQQTTMAIIYGQRAGRRRRQVS